MTTKRKQRRRPAPSPVVVTIQCRIKGKRHALVVTRTQRGVHLVVVFEDALAVKDVPRAVKDAILVEDGEALHTALHALGIFAWGQP